MEVIGQSLFRLIGHFSQQEQLAEGRAVLRVLVFWFRRKPKGNHLQGSKGSQKETRHLSHNQNPVLKGSTQNHA